jgi:hypothetical protein
VKYYSIETVMCLACIVQDAANIFASQHADVFNLSMMVFTSKTSLLECLEQPFLTWGPRVDFRESMKLDEKKLHIYCL